MKPNSILKRVMSILLAAACVSALPVAAAAAETTAAVQGFVYEFDNKTKYDFSAVSDAPVTNRQNTIGEFSISGNCAEVGEKNGCTMYTVASGELTLSYQLRPDILNASETDWHLTEDKNKEVDTFKLSKNILSGAVIVQTSKDGVNWNTDEEYTDAFKSADSVGEIYTTRGIQLENGCFYRVIVVYKMERKNGEAKIAFFTTDVTEEKRAAEVYSFYLVNEKNAGSTESAANEPRKVIARNPIRTEKDKGFSGNISIDKSDPHFGWALGSFVVNGYTRETSYNGNSYFLKNVGDVVTLWFTLDQDINMLDGNSNYSIAEDTKAYDQAFGVKETNFGHGTLIISHTDYQGITHDPIIYTDFLAANATTGADTRVRLFEEGDYKVALDYEIKNTPRKVGPVEVVPVYTDYKIEFEFSIRNGNCMVYPFDSMTGNELSDNAITENGFRLDMAKSRYLTIDVTRTVLNVGPNGILTEDVRFNRPAKDNEVYEDEGIYTFNVSNLYTDSSTQKTIYVGTDKYYTALSKYNLTVADLNAKIADGYTIENDGTLIGLGGAEPEPEPKPEPEPDAVPVETEEPEEETEPSADADEVPESGSSPLPFVLIGLAVVGGGAAFAMTNKGKKGTEE